MDKKLKVAEFAALLGIVPKTVYKMIERNEVITVTERVNNRQTTLIVTNDEQIEEFRKNYGKQQVNNGNYYNSVTENNQSIPVNTGNEYLNNQNNSNLASEVIDKILTLNDGYYEQLNNYSDKIMSINEELISAKSNLLLLEDKRKTAEGDKKHWENKYFEIEAEKKELLGEIEKRNRIILTIVAVSCTLFISGIVGLILFNNTIPQKETVQQPTTDQISVVQPQKNEVKPVAQPRDKIIKK